MRRFVFDDSSKGPKGEALYFEFLIPGNIIVPC